MGLKTDPSLFRHIYSPYYRKEVLDVTKRQKIDQARETRLWIRDVIIPVAGIVFMSPEARGVVVSKFNEAKTAIKTKFNKKD